MKRDLARIGGVDHPVCIARIATLEESFQCLVPDIAVKAKPRLKPAGVLLSPKKKNAFWPSWQSLNLSQSPNGKLFLQKTKLSPGGNLTILKRLEAEAVIYHTSKGYVLSDPLLAHYLRVFR
ncbi:MAG: hypothetical protein HQM16_06915 [Deltaproteobacteria bacterium]|nr:hypothetical protein [Deltaproteobacteria bacterium]